MVPQTSPKSNYLAHQHDIDAAIRRVLESGFYILGEELARFEQDFARYVTVKECVGVANGTDAIELALRGCGVGIGDLVFTVSHTAVGTAVGVERTGATPVFVDVDPQRYTMSPESLEQAITAVKRNPSAAPGKPRAVLVVHLYGCPADLDAIGAIARRHDLLLIEDCAQAHGALHNGRRTGSIGAAAAFSFYPTKNLGAIGDGGAVTTNDPGVAQRVRMLREYGWRERYISDITGVNSRLDPLQAGILGAKLPHLDADIGRRQQVARQYDQALAASDLTLPRVPKSVSHVYHQYVVRCSERDGFREHLKQQGIGTLIHYPAPVHEQPAYRDRLMQVVPLGRTEQIAREVLSLPMYPELTDEQVTATMQAVLTWPALQPAGR